MKMTKEDLIEIYAALNIAANTPGSTRYNFAVAKNMSLIEPDAKAISTAITPGKRFSEWDSKRATLCQQYADRDQNNQPVKDSGKYVISKHYTDFERDLTKLNEEYREDIELQNKKNNEDSAFLKESIEIPDNFLKISNDDLPKELSGRVIRPLLFMISDY